MADAYYMKQCLLEQRNQLDGVVVQTVSWLPERFAVENKVVDLKRREAGEWSRNWKVVTVGSTRCPYAEINERSTDYRHQREASDI